MGQESHDAEMTDRPLHEAIAELMRRRGFTLSALAAILRAEGLTIGRTRLHQIAAGQGPPASASHVERLAQVLGVAPSYFAEYRLWRVRSLLDPAAVGFERAMENLGRLSGRRAIPSAPPNGRPRADDADRYPAWVHEVKERA
ncbi:MAG: helix-turn-helix transcriptional regulator [Actinomycetota bacterium]